ncbi:glycerophosphoryl diester phosphodiesterase membrane domain-containing protein [Luteococcus sp. H138]|uniref:glycerophosphoryl diester phosphodiesterase membrane domain-containing protein n=1 Tax=unclassified Luteococcus TaxID=2639923 RepID=UPI00313F21E3
MTMYPQQGPGQPAGPSPYQMPQQYPTPYGAPPSSQPALLKGSPLGLGDMFAGTWKVLRRRFGLLLGITLVAALVAAALIFIPMMVVMVLGIFSIMSTMDTSMYPMPSLAVTAPVLVLCSAAVAAASVWVWAKFSSLAVAVVDQLARGLEPSWSSAENQTQGSAGRAMPLVWLAGAIGAGAGALISVFVAGLLHQGGDASSAFATSTFLFVAVLVVAGVYLQVRLVYTLPALALEGRSGMDALRRSFQLTGGRFWRTLWFLLIGCGLVALLSVIVQGAEGVFRESPDLAAVGALFSLLGAVANVVLSVWTIAWQTVMYVDRVREEGAPQPQFPMQPGQFTAQSPHQPYPVQSYPGQQAYPGQPAQPHPAQQHPTQQYPTQPQAAPGPWQPTPPPPNPADPGPNPWARQDNQGL